MLLGHKSTICVRFRTGMHKNAYIINLNLTTAACHMQTGHIGYMDN